MFSLAKKTTHNQLVMNLVAEYTLRQMAKECQIRQVTIATKESPLRSMERFEIPNDTQRLAGSTLEARILNCFNIKNFTLYDIAEAIFREKEFEMDLIDNERWNSYLYRMCGLRLH